MSGAGRAGFALVISLLVLVVVAALGVGGLFLSNMNLRMAENVRAQSVAFANAEAGLEIAMVSLFQGFEARNPKEFPISFTTADVPLHPSTMVEYEVAEYSRYGPTLVRVRIRGIGPRSAEYISEAVLGSAVREVDPIFSLGMVSEKSVNIAGASGTFIDAGVHTNDALWLPGFSSDEFQYCTMPRIAATGRCPAEGLVEYAVGSEPLTVYDGGTRQCGPGDGPEPFCSGSTVNPDYLVTEPIDVDPAYAVRRFEAAGGEVGDDGNIESYGALIGELDSPVIGGALCAEAEYLCLIGDQVLTAEMIDGKTVITDGDITLACTGDDCDFANAILISTEGTVNLAALETATDLRVFSEKSILDAPGLWLGQSTLASNDSVTMSGSAKMFPGFRGPAVGMVVIATNDIILTGGGGTEAVGVFIAGRTFRWAGGGGVYIFGSVLIEGAIDISGGYTLDAGADVFSKDLDDVIGSVSVLSRR